MSDSIIGKETISYRKQRVAETTTGPQIAQTIQFAHKFSGGETSFSLLNLTTPTAEMPGFTNPSPSVLSGTGLNANPNALKLYLSITGGGRMVPFDSYRVYGTTIVFVGTLATVGMTAGAVIFGEVQALAANALVVGDGRFIRKTYTLAAGQTTLNLGFTYKVGTNLLTDQIGDIKIYRNGNLQLRNVGNATASSTADGNYQEVDAGNGYSTAVNFNLAPVGQSDTVIVEQGYQISSGQLQIFSELERLQGAIAALANDASLAFGNPVTNYLNANATELDRRQFGDSVLSLGTRMTAAEAKLAGTYTVIQTSNQYACSSTSSGKFLPLTNGFLNLPSAGVWNLYGTMQYQGNGSSPVITSWYNFWADNQVVSETTTPPAACTKGIAGSVYSILNGITSAPEILLPLSTLKVRVAGPTTIYIATQPTASTPANLRVTAALWADRVGDY